MIYYWLIYFILFTILVTYAEYYRMYSKLHAGCKLVVQDTKEVLEVCKVERDLIYSISNIYNFRNLIKNHYITIINEKGNVYETPQFMMFWFKLYIV